MSKTGILNQFIEIVVFNARTVSSSSLRNSIKKIRNDSKDNGILYQKALIYFEGSELDLEDYVVASVKQDHATLERLEAIYFL